MGKTRLESAFILDRIECMARSVRLETGASKGFHTSCQQSLRALGDQFGYYTLVDHEITYPVPGYDARKIGLVDVVWFDQKERPVAAMEIDSARRKKSVYKLKAMDCLRVWILATAKPLDFDTEGIFLVRLWGTED